MIFFACSIASSVFDLISVNRILSIAGHHSIRFAYSVAFHGIPSALYRVVSCRVVLRVIEVRAAIRGRLIANHGSAPDDTVGVFDPCRTRQEFEKSWFEFLLERFDVLL